MINLFNKGPEGNSNNYWVKCPSRKFGGMFYYYNTRTKLSVWNLNDLTVTKDVNFQQIPNELFINREPIKPPNFFANVAQSFGNQSINNPFKVNASTQIKALPSNRIVPKPNLWDAAPNQSIINSKQFISIGTQTADIDEKVLNFQCATPLRKPILREPKLIFGKIKKNYSATSFSSTTDVENIASVDILDIDIQDLNIKDSNSTVTCTKDECGSSCNSLAVTDLRHIITGRRKSKTYHDLEIFANDKESVRDSFILGPFKDKTCNFNEASRESTNENAVENKSNACNLAHLTGLAAPDQMTSPWYLVVDTNMLLLELDFITNFLKSTPDCKLRVPDMVQKQLRNLSVNKLTESTPIIAARRAIRYITSYLSQDRIIKVNSQVSERKEIEECEVLDNVINCCMEIKNTDHFLIVLSNNEVLNKKLHLLGIDCYSTDKLKGVMANRPKTVTSQNNSNVTRKRAFEPITMPNNDSKRMCKGILPKVTTGTFFNNKNNFFKDFLTRNDQTVSTTSFNDISIDNNFRKIIGSARNKVTDTQSIKEITPTFDLTFKSLAEKYNSESLQRNPSMFKINNKIIENKLELRMDEWLCRFVQVMEETLVQVLQSFSSVFTCPPSLTLQEAVAVVHKLHKNNESVKKYCNNFSSLFSALNDTDGKGNKDLLPNKFMEIFASGYQLVELLLDLEKNDVNLDSGIKYLKELLDEINDPELATDNHDFDFDIDPTNYLEVPNAQKKPASSGNKVSISAENAIIQDLKKNDVSLDNGMKYLKELFEDINDPELNVNIDDFDIDPTHYQEKVPNTQKKPASSTIKDSTSTENIIVQVTNDEKQKTTSVEKYFQRVTLTPIPKQNVKNNFKNKCKTIRSSTKTDIFEVDKYAPLQHATFINKDSELPAVEKGKSVLDGNIQVASVFQKFFDDIGITFMSIENFIKETKKRLCTMDNNKKKESGHKLSQIYMIVLNISKCLRQIMYRDRFEDENIRHLISKVVQSHKINDDIIMDYSDKVIKYLDQAGLLENSLNELLTCLKTGAIKIVKTINN